MKEIVGRDVGLGDGRVALALGPLLERSTKEAPRDCAAALFPLRTLAAIADTNTEAMAIEITPSGNS